MKHTLITAASTLVLTLGLAGPAAAAETGSSSTMGSGSGSGLTSGSAGMSGGASASTGTSGGKSIPSFSDLDKDNKGHLTQQDIQSYPQIQTQWEQMDVDKDGQVNRAEFSAFEAGAKWQKHQGGSSSSSMGSGQSGSMSGGSSGSMGGSSSQPR